MFRRRAVMAVASVALLLCLIHPSLAQTATIPRMLFSMPEGVDPTTKFFFRFNGDSFQFNSDVFTESEGNPDPGIELHADRSSRLQFIQLKIELLEGLLPNGLLIESASNPEFPQFPYPWIVGDGSVRDGILLSWQPGAAKIGQPVIDQEFGSYYGALRLVEGRLPQGLVFQVTAYAVPEPGLMALLGAALLSGLPLAYRLRCRR
jgi:hypothetical protein